MLRERRRVITEMAGQALEVVWDDRLEAPRARLGDQHRAVVPMYWFALDRHYETVQSAADVRQTP